MKNPFSPNVLLLYTDQQRWDSLNCNGNENAITPNIDKLSLEGVNLSQYHVQSPICAPSRMSFLTGRYCSSLGIGCNGIPFPHNEATPIWEIFKSNGYHTAQFGKLHFTPHANRDYKEEPFNYGIDDFILSDEPGCYDDAYINWVRLKDPDQVPLVRTGLPAAAKKHGHPSYSNKKRNIHNPYLFEGREDFTHSAFVAEKTCDFLAGQRDKPFFAIAGFYAPHPPINPPERFVKNFKPEKMALPVKGDVEDGLPFLKGISNKEWQKIITYYYALVSHVDDCIGKILKTLKKSGLEEDTIVIFTSDHGEYLGDHGLVQKGHIGHDCITRVPFIIKSPKNLPKNRTLSSLVEGVDFVPTILELCGIPIPEFVEGLSAVSLLKGEVNSFREDVLTEHFFPGNLMRFTTLKTKKWTYCCNGEGEELLFDREKDPGELINLCKNDLYISALSEMRFRMVLRLKNATPSYRKQETDY